MSVEINQVYNCDCRELMRKMVGGGQQVQFILTDPPYGIEFQSQRRGEKFGKIIGDNFNDSEQVDAIYEYFDLCYKILEDDKFLVSFMSWKTIPQFNDAITQAGFTIKSMPIWVKNNFGLGYYTRPQYEPMYLALKGNPPPPQTAISDVISCAKVADLIHSCQKPTDLLCKLINTFSQEGDTVFDGYGGSFSTCVASRMCGRNYISCEIDEKLFEIGSKNLFQNTNQISLFD